MSESLIAFLSVLGAFTVVGMTCLILNYVDRSPAFPSEGCNCHEKPAPLAANLAGKSRRRAH
jgi:hypothetical protein